MSVNVISEDNSPTQVKAAEYGHSLEKIFENLKLDSKKSGLHYHFFKLFYAPKKNECQLVTQVLDKLNGQKEVGWYNDMVGEKFHLKYHPDTAAFVVISTPNMFENVFIPYLINKDCLGSSDALDQSLSAHMNSLCGELTDEKYEIIHDYEMVGNTRKPRVLVQTAGHAAGAVYFYQRKDLTVDPWPPSKKMFGVCLHPKFGGWFALRGVLVFPEMKVGEVPRPEPVDILKTDEEKQQLLEKFNFNWQDWSFRDVIPVESRYSDLQKEYFATKPAERTVIVERIREIFSR